MLAQAFNTYVLVAATFNPLRLFHSESLLGPLQSVTAQQAAVILLTASQMCFH